MHLVAKSCVPTGRKVYPCGGFLYDVWSMNVLVEQPRWYGSFELRQTWYFTFFFVCLNLAISVL